MGSECDQVQRQRRLAAIGEENEIGQRGSARRAVDRVASAGAEAAMP
jgi:hypothetical protein